MKLCGLLGYTSESLSGAAEDAHLHLAKLLSNVVAPIYTFSSRYASSLCSTSSQTLGIMNFSYIFANLTGMKKTQ